jgi:hypothetical protein
MDLSRIPRRGRGQDAATKKFDPLDAFVIERVMALE